MTAPGGVGTDAPQRVNIVSNPGNDEVAIGFVAKEGSDDYSITVRSPITSDSMDSTDDLGGDSRLLGIAPIPEAEQLTLRFDRMSAWVNTQIDAPSIATRVKRMLSKDNTGHKQKKQVRAVVPRRRSDGLISCPLLAVCTDAVACANSLSLQTLHVPHCALQQQAAAADIAVQVLT